MFTFDYQAIYSSAQFHLFELYNDVRKGSHFRSFPYLSSPAIAIAFMVRHHAFRKSLVNGPIYGSHHFVMYVFPCQPYIPVTKLR